MAGIIGKNKHREITMAHITVKDHDQDSRVKELSNNSTGETLILLNRKPVCLKDTADDTILVTDKDLTTTINLGDEHTIREITKDAMEIKAQQFFREE